MTERQMQTFFGKFVQNNSPSQSEVYELKIAKGTSLPFDSVQTHQKVALLQAEQSHLFHKITDQPWLPDRPYSFTAKKPFDCFVLVKVQSYVVLWFYKPRQPKIFIKIRIKDWIDEQNTSSRKSITEQRAKEIGQEFLVKINE